MLFPNICINKMYDSSMNYINVPIFVKNMVLRQDTYVYAYVHGKRNCALDFTHCDLIICDNLQQIK